MGLDIWQERPACKTCGHAAETESFGCTYNLSPMWYAIYPDSELFVDIDGLHGKQAADRLKDAIKLTKKHKKMLINLEQPNGWGSYNSFLTFLEKLLEQTQLNPELKWVAWR